MIINLNFLEEVLVIFTKYLCTYIDHNVNVISLQKDLYS